MAWINPETPEGLRIIVSNVLAGTNYRIYFERATRMTLMQAYEELARFAQQHPQDNEAWKQSIRSFLEGGDTANSELRRWLLGMAKKTADNLGVKETEYSQIFEIFMKDIETAARKGKLKSRDMALLVWAGAATLTIRGSRKSKIGKKLEKEIARAALQIIGLKEGRDFMLGVGADAEVQRETDAEIKTPRGSVRMEIGLIGKGNPEVISDKVGRMSRNDIILVDLLSKTSSAWEVADAGGVKLIQIRNNNPVEILRQHLLELKLAVRRTPLTLDEIKNKASKMSFD